MAPRSRSWLHGKDSTRSNDPVVPRYLIWTSWLLTLLGASSALLFLQPGLLLFAAIGLYMRFALSPDSVDRRIDSERYQSQQPKVEFGLSTWNGGSNLVMEPRD